MASVDSLPGDQRAVLQLVLGRGRSYDEIARLLSINPDAVRERALAALDALGPQTKVDRESRAQICDYLLGQLPESQRDEVRDRLAQSAPDRAWARVASSELASLASGPLPDIPAETSAARAAHQPSAPPVPVAPPPAVAEPAADVAPRPAESQSDSVPAASPAPEGEKKRRSFSRREREPKPPKEPKAPREPKAPGEPKAPREPTPVLSTAGSSSGPRSSRLGGLIVIVVAVVIVVVLLVVVIGSSGSNNKTSTTSTTTAAAAPPATSASSSSATTSAAAPTTTGSSSTSAKVIAQINLTPPAAGSKAAGIAEVLSEGSTDGIAIVAQGVAANTTHPANAYAVWLYNSPTDAKILGFVNPGVTSTGKLSTAGGLPANASHYKNLIVTLEHSADPKIPGTIILQGTLTGLS